MIRLKPSHNPIDPVIIKLVQEHGNKPESLLDILKALQAQKGTLTSGVLSQVALALHLPEQQVFGVASFYSMLTVSKSDQPAAKETPVRVCDGPVCWLCGGDQTGRAIRELYQGQSGWRVDRTSCLGLCDRAPAVMVGDEPAGPVMEADVSNLAQGWRGEGKDYSRPREGELRIMLAQAGKIDPDSLEAALQTGAYQALRAALERSPEEVLREVEASGLTGRGGAGFPVGRKWRFVAQAGRSPRYVVCNADESEPLIFKDRVLIDTNPHQLLEGMAIAGYATGANEAFLYIRGEYALQAIRLENAIHQAKAAGFLGENILGRAFSFNVHVHRGAGAYICGEETALLESLEGKRGEPRTRPPYPPTSGYLGLPTLVNNVESFSAVPAILANGAAWYRSLSSAATPGTKLYIVLGAINQPGLFEAPFGLTLRQVIETYGGGMRAGSQFYFALTGGAAGTIVSEKQLDIPIDYVSAAKGISLGAGAFLICDQSVSPLALLRNLLNFFAAESCGKCTPCRLGTRESLIILSRMCAGESQAGDVERMLNLAEVMQNASFCGLGQSVAIPMKSALLNFPAQFHQST